MSSEQRRSSAETLALIQTAVRSGQHRFTLHALSRAGAYDLLLEQIEEAVCSAVAEIIEDYLQDPRGPSCLVYGKANSGTVVHVVCSHPPEVAVITCYRPAPDRWTPDLKSRKREQP